MAVAEFLAKAPLPFFHLFALVCLAAIVYKLVAIVQRRRHFTRHVQQFPAPPTHWLFGHVRELYKDGDELFTFLRWQEQYQCAIPLWIGPDNCFVNLHHPDYVRTVLASVEPKDDVVYPFFEPWIGEGLLLASGQKWFRHRRLLTRGFHYDVLKPYVKLMSDSAKTMLDKWESYAHSGESLELFEHVSLMALDSILKCAFSYNSNCQTESGTNAYVKAVFDLSELINKRFMIFPYYSDLIFRLSPHGFRFRKACKIAHNHTAEVIRARKEVLKREEEMDRVQTKRYQDFLDILLLAKDEDQMGLTEEEIRAEVDTFMFEGHDTTASGISFILYSLACNPEHQKLCREEVMQALGGKKSFEVEDLGKIPYTTMCIKESLRLYPPVPGVSRVLTKPMTFVDGRSLPAGFRVGVAIFGLHRNPSVWENPSVFDPLRFLPENVSRRSPHAFVPFAAGPRNCIGQNFAMNELKVTVAETLRRYELMEVPNFKPRIVPRLVLRSLNGVYIKIKPLDSY
ncbi:cytochrome P450 4B1-like [Neosynchiropus ocellatus]